MTEPAPIGDVLAGVAQARQALGRPSAILEPGSFDHATEEVLAGRAVADMRRISWAHVCPQRFASATLDDAPAEVADDLHGWAAMTGPRPNVVLVGPVGTGKTHLALALVRDDYLERGVDVLFAPTAEMLDQLRPGGHPEAMHEYLDVGRLVLDDVGAERPTDWTAERLGLVVNRRWMEERPIVATTNLEPSDLREALGERTYSRLVGSDALVVRLSGDDRRRQR